MQRHQRLRVAGIALALFVGVPLTLWLAPTVGPYIGRYLLPTRWDLPVVDRKAVVAPQFTPLWTRSDIYMSVGIGDDAPLFVIDNSIFLIAGSTPNEPLALLRLDMADGKRLWSYSSYNTKLTHNSRYFFLGEQGVVTAVDMNSGEQVWRRRLPVSKAVERIAANEELVSVDVVPTFFYVLDAETGQVYDSTALMQTRPYFYGDHETLEFHMASQSVWAQDKQSGEIVWKQSLGITLTTSPILKNNQLIVKQGQIGPVFAFESETGSPLWQSADEAVSNVAVDDAIVCFLTENAQLVVLSIETGQPVATLDFTPNALIDPFDKEYHVAIHAGVVVVYFGDSRELYAFRYSGTG